MPLTKTCVNCGQTFEKTPNVSLRTWKEQRRYCSNACKNAAKEGTPFPYDGPRPKPWLGKHRSAETRRKISATKLAARAFKEKSPNWKGDEAKYAAVHMWIRKHFTKTGRCEACSMQRRTQWANLTGNYDREARDDWAELCSSCHKLYDLDRLVFKGKRLNERRV